MKIGVQSFATRVAAGFGDKRVAIHGGHGIFTTGQSIDEAVWWFVLMNRCCESQLMAEAGTSTRWQVEDARRLASMLGSPSLRMAVVPDAVGRCDRADPDLVD